MDAQRVTTYLLPAILGAALVFGVSKKVFGAEPDEYKVVGSGFCEDVQLRCVKVIVKGVELYGLYRRGVLVAITRMNKDGTEEVLPGNIELPLKKGEYEI